MPVIRAYETMDGGEISRIRDKHTDAIKNFDGDRLFLKLLLLAQAVDSGRIDAESFKVLCCHIPDANLVVCGYATEKSLPVYIYPEYYNLPEGITFSETELEFMRELALDDGVELQPRIGISVLEN